MPSVPAPGPVPIIYGYGQIDGQATLFAKGDVVDSSGVVEAEVDITCTATMSVTVAADAYGGIAFKTNISPRIAVSDIKVAPLSVMYPTAPLVTYAGSTSRLSFFLLGVADVDDVARAEQVKAVADAYGLSSAWSNQIYQVNWGSNVKPDSSYATDFAARISNATNDNARMVFRASYPAVKLPAYPRWALDLEYPDFITMEEPVDQAVIDALSSRRAGMLQACGVRSEPGIWGLGKSVNNDVANPPSNRVRIERAAEYIRECGFDCVYTPVYARTYSFTNLVNRAQIVLSHTRKLVQLVRTFNPRFRNVFVFESIVRDSTDGGAILGVATSAMWQMWMDTFGDHECAIYIQVYDEALMPYQVSGFEIAAPILAARFGT